MLCYRYLSRKWGLETLKTGKYKLSRVEEMNDLFDCTGVYSGYPSYKAFMKCVYPSLTAEGKQKLLKIKKSGDAAGYRFITRGLTDEIRMKYNYETFNLRRPICDNLRLLCMSEAQGGEAYERQMGESLMWAHYGEKGFDGFHDMTRKNAEPFTHLRMHGVLNMLSLSPVDCYFLESEIFPIGG